MKILLLYFSNDFTNNFYPFLLYPLNYFRFSLPNLIYCYYIGLNLLYLISFLNHKNFTFINVFFRYLTINFANIMMNSQYYYYNDYYWYCYYLIQNGFYLDHTIATQVNQNLEDFDLKKFTVSFIQVGVLKSKLYYEIEKV